VAIEYRWAEGSDERATEIASEFIRLKVDVIVTSGGVLLGAKRVTTAIPIVFAIANDPVGSGFVASLARPGGNITGLSLQSTDIATKRLELLREILPGIRRLAILVNGGNPGAALELGEVGTAARAFGLEVSTVEIRRAEDIVPAFEVLKGHAEALYVDPDALIVANRVRLNILTLTNRLPTIFGVREFVEIGGLLSYGPNFPDLFRRAGDYVDKILRGTKTGRHSGRTADQVRPRREPDHCQGARCRSPCDATRARRRRDRVAAVPLLHLLRSGIGTYLPGVFAAACPELAKAVTLRSPKAS